MGSRIFRCIRRTQLLFATGIEGGIDDHQLLKYQPSVTSRVIFHYLIPLIIIVYWNISLDVTNGWYFRTWWSWMLRSMPVANSNWVRLLIFIDYTFPIKTDIGQKLIRTYLALLQQLLVVHQLSKMPDQFEQEQLLGAHWLQDFPWHFSAKRKKKIYLYKYTSMMSTE